MWQLTFRGNPTGVPIGGENLDPVVFVEMNENAISAISVQHGNRKETLGELFSIEWLPDEFDVPTLKLVGDWSSVDGIGRRLGGGRIVVEGNAGLHLGEGMTGGVIDVFGNANDFVGRDMIGGRIHIRGNAGHGVGSGSIGAKVGMIGGTILVEGSVGDEAGKKMRRGLIAVGGSCGEFAGASMIAGTIMVFGPPGRHPGPGLKRGTIAFLRPEGDPPKVLASYKEDGVFTPLFLNVYLKRLADWGFPNCPVSPVGRFLRWRGDLLEMGKGEILAALPS